MYIFSFFNVAVSNSDDVTSNDSLIANFKRYGWKLLWLNLSYRLCVCLEGVGKATNRKTLRIDSIRTSFSGKKKIYYRLSNLLGSTRMWNIIQLSET